MQDHESEILKAKCLHYATGFPVCVKEREKAVYALPEKQTCAADLAGSGVLRFVPSETEQTVQYVLSPAGERFVYLRLSSGVSVTLGPFLTDPVPDVFIAQLIRAGLVRMHLRHELRKYFDSLEPVSIQKYYYAGKLTETLFADKAASEPSLETAESTLQFLPDSYYTQAQTYRSRQFLHSPYMTEQEISHYISIGDTEGALHILAEINTQPKAQLAGTELRSLKNSVICSCAFMTRAAIQGGVRADDAFTMSDAYIRDIEACGNARSVLDFEKKMVLGFTAAVKNNKLGKYSPAVSRAIGYIEDHLTENIPLRQVADAVFLNPNYLSGLFNREVGCSMHAYVVKRRIEEASYFVKNSSEPLADIASFFQFSSQSHFVQSFKKVLGVTPGEYRKNRAGT